MGDNAFFDISNFEKAQEISDNFDIEAHPKNLLL
jgi:hypothetical protein